MSRPFTPIRHVKPSPSSYTAESVCRYIDMAYGEVMYPSKVTLGLSCPQEALEKLGFEHPEGDWFDRDPRIPKPKFPLGTKVVTRNGGVGAVKDVSEVGPQIRYHIEEVEDWKRPDYCAWWEEKELRLLKGES